jgi:hypothetical protein
MELLDRYLQAVGFWLPKKQKQDILAELDVDIRSQIEERETGQGRKMEPKEVEAVLKNQGSPFLVAQGYLPRRHLIGPVLFPIYTFVLQLLLLVYFAPWMLVWTVLAVFVPSFRAAHPGPELLHTLSSLWFSALSTFTFVTLGFAIAEHLKVADRISEKWTPRKLPAIKNVLRIPRSSSIAEIAAGAIFFIWWLGIARLPVIHAQDGGSASWFPGRLWESFHGDFLIPVALLGAVEILIAVVNLARPVWTKLRLGIRAALDGIMLAIVVIVLVPRWPDAQAWIASMKSSRHAAATAATLAAGMDLSVFVLLFAVGLATLGSCLAHILRIIRWKASLKSTSA